jgi:hypothetical protein
MALENQVSALKMMCENSNYATNPMKAQQDQKSH